eukprot:CAMPEP_0197177334 /NCGR_PEP_ID=MMETSP1423-20130617/2977_1 /TAXON_ID=476441 /ORGANISM="Pseudo-nitzschia heimii, Strain UNC1101" /LENGTH=546 /DNA_ID=CAMNT_0042626863 /DNA_START=84 /DNA_END=1724 /DNA_ORIENTATION=-
MGINSTFVRRALVVIISLITSLSTVKTFASLKQWEGWQLDTLDALEGTNHPGRHNIGTFYDVSSDERFDGSGGDSGHESGGRSGEYIDDGSDFVGSGSAFCLLIKDDNDILSEWIAYHYHVFRMRQLIVAVDPSSKTSPSEILKRWTSEGSNGNFDLDVTVMENDQFMPDYFRSEPKDYSKMPFTTLWQANVTKLPLSPRLRTHTAEDINLANFETEEQRAVAHKVNNHQIRQRYFYYRCMKRVKRKYPATNISWTALIDTDEYLVPNPWVSSHVYDDAPVNETLVDTVELNSMFPGKPGSNSLLAYFHRFLDQNHRLLELAGIGRTPTWKGCVMMPRILFGSKEDDEAADTTTGESLTTAATTTTWDHAKFESLRWRYHQNYNEGFETFFESKPGNYPMKAILDVSRHEFTPKEGFDANGIPFSLPGLHWPSRRCFKEPTENNFIENSRKSEQPIAIYHYLGSKERFLYRGDNRRDPHIYEAKNNVSNYAYGDANRPAANDSGRHRGDERWWIKGWFDSFVATYGADAAYSVLGEEFATRTKTER